MKVTKISEGTVAEVIHVSEIEGDMGEDVVMSLMQQPDGDMIIGLSHPHTNERLSVEFCTFGGGGHRPAIAKKLRELLQILCTMTNTKDTGGE